MSTMASSNSERSSLLDSTVTGINEASRKSIRNVAFSPKPVFLSQDRRINSAPLTNSSSLISPTIPARISLNNRFRRRGSATNPKFSSPNNPKIAPQRTTKNIQKVKILPNPDFGDEGQDEESGREVYSQYTRIKDPNARRDAAKLGKADRDRLPRVTAYCTASKYQIENMMRFLKGRGRTKGANPKLVDECIYTPYRYNVFENSFESSRTQPGSPHNQERRFVDSGIGVDALHQSQHEVLINVQSERENATGGNKKSDHINDVHNIIDEGPMNMKNYLNLDTQVHTPEIFIFGYGVVVIWGMSLQDEQRFLKEIARFENEKLDPNDMETECFNFYYTQEYQPQIYNDFISLRDKNAYMTKLAISHALAQSVKTSLFEELVDNTIEACKDIPGQIATTGKIALSRTQINMQIGELFILRINMHLNGSVLDTPEIFWLEPHLEPVYQAVRSYLEIDQRVSLLNERLDVIADLLAVLKDQLSHRHGEMLEWIGAEILVAAVNILVDQYADI
ncbi:hypothetical protein EPUL_005583, partial [Erysiphe pulchra]